MKISLCMIARDEEAFLEGCLQSIASCVDQIVVVDTGSTDGTVRIARSHGARVVPFAWCDDFAAARNAALPHASGDYILMLDADERLTPAGAAAIRRECDADRADCWMLPLYNADSLDAPVQDVIAGTRRKEGVVYQPRVLRRTPDLRWSGSIHENPRAWLEAPGRIVASLDAPVVHYGYAPDVVASRDKVARNERLLREQCAAEPRDPDPRIYLAKTLISDGRRDQAWPVLDEAWRLVRDGPPADRTRAPVVMLVIDVLSGLAQHEPSLGARYAAEALAWGVSHPNVSFLAGVSFERAAEASGDPSFLERAAAEYRRGIAWAEPPTVGVIPGVREWRMPVRLGLVLSRQGRAGEALRVLEPALRVPAADPHVQCAYAEALCAAGSPASALPILEPMMAAGKSSDAWWLAAVAMDRLGDPHGAEQVRALAQGLRAPSEPHRTRLHAETAGGAT